MTQDGQGASNRQTKPRLFVVEGTDQRPGRHNTTATDMTWTLDVLFDLKSFADSRGAFDVANEIEVAYERVKFLLAQRAD